MTDPRKRIEELEEALRPFAPTPEVLQAIQYIHDSGELYLSENGWQIGPITAGDFRRAAALLSASPPASEPDADVVERVARAMFVSDPPAGMIGPDWDTGATLGKGNATRHKFHALARAALSAMRPSVDAEKIAGIRARHESVADMADDEWDNRIYTIADDAFSDRAFLLSVIEGVSHDD